MKELEIKKLSDYSHARIRTEMFLNSRSPHTQTILLLDDLKPVIEEMTWVPALFVAFREIFDNSLDEVIGHGHGNRIDVTYDEKTRIISVKDNGRGIPITYDGENKEYSATLAMSHARAGRNFGDRGFVAGTNGIGAAVVNFCSEFFIMDIYRDGKHFQQKFSEGNIVVGDNLQIHKPSIKNYSGSDKGTRIEFKLSKEVFKDYILPIRFIKSRVTEAAICNPTVKFFFNDVQIKVKPKVEQNIFSNKNVIHVPIKQDSFKSTFWLVPNFVKEGDHSHTVVNNIPAFDGGTHVDTFKRTFYSNLLVALERESKRRKLTPNRSDISEGILIYNITTMLAPNFDSQSKTRLISADVGKIIQTALDDEDLYKQVIKNNKEWIDSIYARCAERTQKKESNEIAKLAKKVGKAKVAGLMDATGIRRSNCMLFIAEGDSAIGGIASVRDPELHGGLALSGKVLNVFGESPKKVLENSVLLDLMNSLNLTIGERANRHTMRYGKIFIAADQDPDGANITALLVNFFYTFWPELFDANQTPVLYTFMTPFIIAEKGKQRKYWYAHDYQDFDPNKYSGWSITRAKGLGTLTEEDWKNAISSPVLIPIVDDGKLKNALDLVFNDTRADDRKDWIKM